jgi:5-deoxy-D-glucuronate isomerase
MGLQTATKNFVANGLVVSAVFTTARTGLYPSHTHGTKNTAHEPFVNPYKVLLSPLQLNWALKNFFNALDQKWPSILIPV